MLERVGGYEQLRCGVAEDLVLAQKRVLFCLPIYLGLFREKKKPIGAYGHNIVMNRRREKCSRNSHQLEC